MKVIYEDDLRRLNALTAETKAINKKIVKITGQVRNDIEKRTQDGKTARGGNAPSYSPNYLEWKRKAKDRLTPVSHRDLTLNGDMLNSMRARAIAGGAEIYFDKPKEQIKAIAHHFGFGQRRFSFFALSRQNKSYIESELQKDFK